MEQYAAYLYTSTSIFKMLFYQKGTACLINITVYLSGGRIIRYSSEFPNMKARNFAYRRIYYSDARGVYCATVKPVRQGRNCYNQSGRSVIHTEKPLPILDLSLYSPQRK